MSELFRKPPSSASSCERTVDLATGRIVKQITAESPDDFFVLTGSYAIEAVTGGDISHNDIDANIFTTDIARSLARIRRGIATSRVLSDTRITATKPDRLEYEVAGATGNRQLELQFVHFERAERRADYIELWLPPVGGRDVVIPTEMRTLSTQEGTQDFRVKTLPFAIATWALRISGTAAAQKRAVRQSDIDHFAYLVGSPHDPEEVATAMERHPQMPPGYDARDVLQAASQRATPLI